MADNFLQPAVVIIFGVPESPRYLCKMGQPQRALEVLSQVYDKPKDHQDIMKEHNDIVHALQLEQAGGEYRWRNVLKSDRMKTGRRILLAYMVSFINQ